MTFDSLPRKRKIVRHLSFRHEELEAVIAHDGIGKILTRRAMTKRLGSPINFIDITIVPSGTSIGLHTHKLDEEEIYIVISGYGEMIVDGEAFKVAPGDVIINYPGEEHGLKTIGDVPLSMVVIEVEATPF